MKFNAFIGKSKKVETLKRSSSIIPVRHKSVVNSSSVKRKTLKQIFKRDIFSILIFILIIILFGIGLSTEFNQLLQRENVFIKKDQTFIESESKKSIKELLGTTSGFTLKSLKVQKPSVIEEGATYLLIGDSMMQVGIGSAIEDKIINGKAGDVRREAIQSTGLLHEERLNWFAHVQELLNQKPADVVLIMFGLNDADHFFDDDGVYQYLGSDGWKIGYAKKVDKMMHILIDDYKVKKVIWISNPKSRDDFFDRNGAIMNEIFQTVVTSYVNGVYVDIYNPISNNGAYTDYATNEAGVTDFARQGDGIHFNFFGGEVVSEIVIKKMRESGVNLN